jgi:hypothetical protein
MTSSSNSELEEQQHYRNYFADCLHYRDVYVRRFLIYSIEDIWAFLFEEAEK